MSDKKYKLPLGFMASGVHCGIKKNDNKDLALIVSDIPAQAAGVYTKNIVKQTGVPCPLDGGMLVERRSRKGRIFYGCSNYPQCRFSVWDKPVPGKCPRCGSLMVQPNQRSKKGICCSNKECGYKASSSPEAVEDPVSRSTGGARLNS